MNPLENLVLRVWADLVGFWIEIKPIATNGYVVVLLLLILLYLLARKQF